MQTVTRVVPGAGLAVMLKFRLSPGAMLTALGVRFVPAAVHVAGDPKKFVLVVPSETLMLAVPELVWHQTAPVALATLNDPIRLWKKVG